MLKDFRNHALAQLVLLAFVGCSMTLHASTLDCTNTITISGTSGFILNSQISSGTCVQNGDKLFGDFNLGNLPTGGFTLFTNNPEANLVSVTFFGNFLQNTTYNFGYELAVASPLNFISALSANILQTVGTSSLMATLTPTGTGMINFTTTGVVVSGNTSSTFTQAQDVRNLIVNETFQPGADSNASGILNSIDQTVIPEPSSLLLFGSGLLGLASWGRRRWLKR